MAVLAFGDLALDPERGELRTGGEAVDLSPLTIRLLVYLALNRSRTVPVEELREEVWEGVHVTEAAVHQAVRQARVAVGDDGRRQAVIRTFARSGYRFVAAVRELAPEPVAQPDDYLGRAGLLRELAADIDAVLAGQPRMWLLSGAPGIGKTRTLDEAASLAHLRGLLVVRGAGSSQAGAPPFWPWVQVLRGLATGRPVTALRRAVHGLAPGLLEASQPASSEAAWEAAKPGARFRLFDEVTQCLRRASALGPLAVLLDDLHDAGSAAFDLLEFVAREIGSDAALLLVAAQRPAEALRSKARAAAIARLRDDSTLRLVTLEGLTDVESRKLVARHEPRPLEPALVDALVARAAGNPFFLKELALSLGREEPGRGPGAWDPGERVARGVRELLEARLAALSPAALGWLRTASVIGPRFERSLVGRLLPDMDAEGACDEARRLGFVVDHRSGEGDASFTHALVRDAVYDGIRPGERRALHLRLGESLVNERPEQAAVHFAEAVPLGSVERAVGLLRQAADRARRHFDAESAGQLYGRALALLDGADSHDAGLRCDLLIAYAEAVVQHGMREEATEALETVLRIARSHGWGARFAQATLTDAYSVGYDAIANPALAGRLDEALMRLDPHEYALRARLLSRLAIEVRYRPHGSEEADRLLEEALGCARRSGDRSALARVLEDTTLVRWSAAGSRRWIDLSRELIAAARDAGDDDLVFRGFVGLVTEAMQVGDRAEMERHMERCRGLAERFPAPHQRASITIMRTARLLLDGDFASAERGLHHSLESGAPELALPAFTQLYYHHLETGRVAELEGQLRELVRSEPHRDAWKLGLARLTLEDGRSHEARMLLTRVTPAAERPRDRMWLPIVALEAEIVVALGDAAAAEKLHALLEPHAALNVVYGIGTLFYGSVSHFLGSLAALAGRGAEAEARLESAQAMHERMESAPWTLHTRVERAALGSSRSDNAAAAPELATLREEAARLGMRALLRRIDALERERWPSAERGRRAARP